MSSFFFSLILQLYPGLELVHHNLSTHPPSNSIQSNQSNHARRTTTLSRPPVGDLPTRGASARSPQPIRRDPLSHPSILLHRHQDTIQYALRYVANPTDNPRSNLNQVTNPHLQTCTIINFNRNQSEPPHYTLSSFSPTPPSHWAPLHTPAGWSPTSHIINPPAAHQPPPSTASSNSPSPPSPAHPSPTC